MPFITVQSVVPQGVAGPGVPERFIHTHVQYPSDVRYKAYVFQKWSARIRVPVHMLGASWFLCVVNGPTIGGRACIAIAHVQQCQCLVALSGWTQSGCAS